jgi:hypothetical protein
VPERATRPSSVRWIAPAAAAALAALALAVASAFYPIPIVIGAQPVPLIAAFALATALAVVALLARPEARKPRVDMSRRELVALLAWWVGAFLVATLLAYASWKAWWVIAVFVAIGLLVKVIQVASHLEHNIRFQIWMPFAAIITVFVMIIVIVQVFGRMNLPPPITSALDAYGPDPPALAPATRTAPDLSSINARLEQSGDIVLGGLKTTKFTYDFHGSGVDVYLADIGFPAPRGSIGVDDPPGWWTEVNGTAFETGPKGTNFLVVAWSTEVADRFAVALAQQLSS